MKNVLVGVCGGIAAYKSVELCRRLVERGYHVRVVMTAGAMEFVQPLTFQAVSGNPIHHELFDLEAEAAMGHIDLAKWADQIVVAPATANSMARLAHGLGDDLLSTLCLASNAPIAIAPAMNQQMWRAPATQANLAVLKEYGMQIVGPGEGAQACGDIGLGRMLEPLEIIETVFSTKQDLLAGQHWLITAGPTREQIDPVRFLSNNSSGKMGFAIARAAAALGARVSLIAGPSALETPSGVDRLDVVSTQQMLESTMAKAESATTFVACAAVSDYRVKNPATEKIKKHEDAVTLELVKNPDILAQVAKTFPSVFCVGFAAETSQVENYAINKLKAKSIDMICANNVADNAIGFDSNENELLIFDKHEKMFKLSKASKNDIARQLVELIEKNRTEQV